MTASNDAAECPCVEPHRARGDLEYHCYLTPEARNPKFVDLLAEIRFAECYIDLDLSCDQWWTAALRCDHSQDAWRDALTDGRKRTCGMAVAGSSHGPLDPENAIRHVWQRHVREFGPFGDSKD